MTAQYHARARQVPLANSVALTAANLKKLLNETGVGTRPETREALEAARRDIDAMLPGDVPVRGVTNGS